MAFAYACTNNKCMTLDYSCRDGQLCPDCNEPMDELEKPNHVNEIVWLREQLRLYQRTEYPESCCPWEQAFRNRLNEVAGQGQLFLHGTIKEE
ncbi:hypothetical protein LCGC14_1853270 [marine sediment metagenome]|uniref:Uncharacterized protein n=1 Tax=marine sediment metagenome TaxID=412755 RepID=A0A0F9J8W4_9ZZZZ